MTSSLSVALVGNPNCGKTTLFNALTGARQHVGNWPGVTVERKTGEFVTAGCRVVVVDLPGVYALTLSSATAALDARIASDVILAREADVIVNIIDASNLERHLYLTLQLLEMGLPVLVALNMMDVAKARQWHIAVEKLSTALGCPVIALTANKKQGIAALQQAIITYRYHATTLVLPYHDVIKQAIHCVRDVLPAEQIFRAVRLLEEDVPHEMAAQPVYQTVTAQQKKIRHALGEDADILLADTRYRAIQQLMQQCTTQTQSNKKSWTSRIDNIVLHRVLGVPIFLGIMYLLFIFAINVGGAFQDFFDMTSQTLFVDGFAFALTEIGAPTWLTALLANGVGKGMNTVVTFIPVLGALFFFLALLEDSGYMARAAFVIDRCMRFLGLPGKAFVPMIVGFGCNVPAVMAARTLENKRDRILTIVMSPFMSCGARLAIYAVFTAAFFPHGGQNIVFALYLIGIAMAMLTGFLLRQTVLRGQPSPLVMELPLYHVPHFTTVLLHAWQRLRGFVFRAGKLIVPICVLIGALNAINIDGSLNSAEAGAQSLLSSIGRGLTPLFAPMGIQTNNWPATVGLVTGVLAKEVVIGTLNTLYTQMGHLTANGVTEFHLWSSLAAAWQSIPENLAQLSHAFRNPLLAQAPLHDVNQAVYGVMTKQFDGAKGAFAYLLFVLLYFPCISTLAVMLRELHRGWSIFSACWMGGVAYGVAVFFYQAATFSRHPVTSSAWLFAISSLFCSTLFLLRWYAANQGNNRLQSITVTQGESP